MVSASGLGARVSSLAQELAHHHTRPPIAQAQHMHTCSVQLFSRVFVLKLIENYLYAGLHMLTRAAVAPEQNIKS